MPGLRFPKPRPAALERQDRRRERTTRDEAENMSVRARSGGRCEVTEDLLSSDLPPRRCRRRAWHIHHMIGGWGRRARGPSILAEHKQHVCAECHEAITRHILQRVGGDPPFWADVYRREH